MKKIILTTIGAALVSGAALANPYETELSTPPSSFEFSHSSITGANQAGDDVITTTRVYTDGDLTWFGQTQIYYNLNYLTPYIQNLQTQTGNSMLEWTVDKIVTATGLPQPDLNLTQGERFVIIRNQLQDMATTYGTQSATITALTSQVDTLMENAASNQTAINELNAEVIDLRFQLKLVTWSRDHNVALRRELQEDIEDLEAEIANLETQIDAHQAAQAALIVDNNLLTSQNAAINAYADGLQATIDGFPAAIEARRNSVVIDLSDKSPLAEEHRVNGERTTEQPINGSVGVTSYANSNGNHFVDQVSYNLTMDGVTVRSGVVDALVWNNPMQSGINILNELGMTYRDAYETGWSDGWEEGYDQGYTDGYDEGFIDGYVTGWNDALDAAIDEVD